MLSRVASNIYWMARYIERAENTARLINVNTHLLLDLPKGIQLGWEPIIDIVSSRQEFYEHYQTADERSVVKFMVMDAKNPSSIISSLAMARENARTIRDIIPREAWEEINEQYLNAKSNSQSVLTHRHRYDYLRAIILDAQTVTGILAGTMTHDIGYSFLRMGRNLERADMTSRIIDVRSATLLPDVKEDLSPFENLQWVSVLKSLTAYQMYRREMRSRVRRPDVLKFLLHEEDFPRAFNHTLKTVEQCVQELPQNEAALKLVESLHQKLLSAEPQELKQEKLHEFIDELQLGLVNIDNCISETYF